MIWTQNINPKRGGVLLVRDKNSLCFFKLEVDLMISCCLLCAENGTSSFVWCSYGRSTSWKIPVQPASANCSPIITCEITPEGHSDHMWDVLRPEDSSVSDGNSGHVTKPSLELDRCRVEGDQIPVAGTVNKIILMAGLE